MRAFLGYMTVRYDRYHIRAADGRKPMRHDYRGTPAAQLVKRLLDKYLGRVVKRRGRFVKDKYRRVLKEYARYAEALLLTAGKTHSALAYLGVVAVLKRHHPVVYVGAPRCLYHLFIGGVKPAVEDIVAYRAVEKEDILLNYTYVLSQRVKGHIVDIFAVNAYPAAAYRVKVRNEVAYRGLAAARGTDKRQRASVRHVQVYAVQYLGRLRLGVCGGV